MSRVNQVLSHCRSADHYLPRPLRHNLCSLYQDIQFYCQLYPVLPAIALTIQSNTFRQLCHPTYLYTPYLSVFDLKVGDDNGSLNSSTTCVPWQLVQTATLLLPDLLGSRSCPDIRYFENWSAERLVTILFHPEISFFWFSYTSVPLVSFLKRHDENSSKVSF